MSNHHLTLGAKPESRRGFTLVELLVVVAIIAVLLSLLLPAMDRAIYRAELVQCATQLKAWGTGLTTGAVQRNRYYPKRKTTVQPLDVGQFDIASQTPRDERPELRDYMGMDLNKLLNCPLSRPVDIDKSALDSLTQTSYALWHDWPTGPGEKAMKKLGDRWSFYGDSYTLLANDYELLNGSLYVGQPDRDNVLTPYIVNDSGAVPGWDKQTTATWYGTVQRGLIDVNTVYTDNAVLRMSDVSPYELGDDRTAFVPNLWNNGSTASWQRIAAR